MKTLFDVPEIIIEKPTVTCRNCIYRYQHDYGNMFYCEKQKQKRTAYGHKKIKAGDKACNLYQTIKP